MRTLRVAQFAPGPYMGAYFPNLARHADPTSLDLRFLSLGEPRPVVASEFNAAGAATVSLPGPSRKAYPRAARALARYLRAERVDVLHAHGWEAGLIASLLPRRHSAFVLGRHHT